LSEAWRIAAVAIALPLAYLSGAVSYASLVTRVVAGKDIRRLGTGTASDIGPDEIP
jgi:glycerol-3-phosphate acyltransferase PlsY